MEAGFVSFRYMLELIRELRLSWLIFIILWNGWTRQFEKRKRGQRGKTLAPSTLMRKEPIDVEVNAYHQPCSRETSNKVATWIGCVARDLKYLPWDYDNWRLLPKHIKEDAWKRVKLKFVLQEDSKSWVISELNSRWRKYKHSLKTDYYDKYDTDEERKANIDISIMPEEKWYAMFTMWDKPEKKAICQRNRENRGKQHLRHTMGRTSAAVVREEMQRANPNHEPPTRIEMFEVTHKSKKIGRFANEETATTMENLYEGFQKRSQDSQADPKVHEEVFIEVMGSEHHSRVRLMGPIVKPTQVYGTKAQQFERQSQEMREMRELLKQQQDHIERHGQVLTALSQQFHDFSDRFGTSETQSPSQTQ